MPLIKCQDCGKEISDSALSCIGCGRPMVAANSTDNRAQPLAPEASVRQMACSNCGSTHVKKLSLLYEENRATTETTTKATGVGISTSGHVGIGVGGAKSESVSLTDLARRAAPPDRAGFANSAPLTGMGVTLVIAVVIAFLVYSGSSFFPAFMAFLVVVIVGANIGRVINGPEIDQRHGAAMAKWQLKYMCLRCGTIMMLSGTKGDQKLAAGEEDARLDELIRAGEKIMAVDHIQKTAGLGFVEAHRRVEERAREL